MAAGAVTYMTKEDRRPRSRSRRIPARNPSLARRLQPVPMFWPTKTATEAQPLSPNELANPSIRLAAVKAAIVPVPRELTVPWTRSFPM